MNDARAVVGVDRLPWLTDEPKPREKKPRGGSNLREFLGWAVAAVLLVAGVAYWLGMRSGQEVRQVRAPQGPAASVKLPEPTAATRTPEVVVEPPPQVRPTPAERMEAPKPKARTVRKVRQVPPGKSASAQASKNETANPLPVARPKYPPLWPARETRGASGRLVQIGAFGSRQQAKLGWRRMTRAYPAVGRLPAVVVETRNSRGRHFYRFQIGTTSQAHSEVLCQWMQRIRFSCAVIGLPWKAKVER